MPEQRRKEQWEVFSKRPKTANAQQSVRLGRVGAVMTCSRCGLQGHNKKACTNAGCDLNPYPPSRAANDKGNKKKRAINNQIDSNEQTTKWKRGRPKKNKTKSTLVAVGSPLMLMEINT